MDEKYKINQSSTKRNFGVCNWYNGAGIHNFMKMVRIITDSRPPKTPLNKTTKKLRLLIAKNLGVKPSEVLVCPTIRSPLENLGISGVVLFKGRAISVSIGDKENKSAMLNLSPKVSVGEMASIIARRFRHKRIKRRNSYKNRMILKRP